MESLRTAVSLISANDPDANDISPGATRAKALRLFAVLPTVVAMDNRRRLGLGAVQPRDDLGYAANFLNMIFGKVPEPQIVAAFETSLILYAEDKSSAPAAAADVATSTRTDLYTAVTAAIGAPKGPSHGGSEAVVPMLNEIGIPDNAKPWVQEALADNRQITAFCNGDCENGDRRGPIMRAALGMIAALRRDRGLLDVYEALIEAAHDAKALHPNLDYPTGLAHHLMSLDTPTFTPIPVVAKLPGWTARIVGQLAASARETGKDCEITR